MNAHFIDWTVFAVYLAVVFGVGIHFTKRQHSQEDFFVGGRKMNWIAVGVSLFATSFSSISFLAYPREGAYEDYHLFLTLLCIPLLIVPILWFVFVPLYQRLGLTSIYEYLEIRFNRAMRRTGTILFFGYALGWMGSMLYGMGLILQAVLGLTGAQTSLVIVGIGLFAVVYTSLGGVQAVIWNDVLQTIVLGGGVLIVFMLAIGMIDGGLGTVIRMGIENGKFDMFNLAPDFQERRTLYAALAFALFMYLPGYTVSQTTAQRYLCMGSLAEARRSLIVSSLVSTGVCFLFFFSGTTLYAFYHQPGMVGFPGLASGDQLMPHFVANSIDMTGLVGIIVAGLFAAALSTIDSGINSMTAVVVYDWLGGRDVDLNVSRFLSAAFGVLVIAAALVTPLLGEFLIEIIAKIVGVFLGLLLGVFLLGMCAKRANTVGAFTGMFLGGIALAFVWTMTDVPHWWYGAVTIGVTFFAGWGASLFSPAGEAA